jgi:hypothetical protein
LIYICKLIGIGNEEIATYPKLGIGKYITEVAQRALKALGNPTVAGNSIFSSDLHMKLAFLIIFF